jgi:hypothetical protein
MLTDSFVSICFMGAGCFSNRSMAHVFPSRLIKPKADKTRLLWTQGKSRFQKRRTMRAAAKDTRLHTLWHHIPIHESMKIFREVDQEEQKNIGHNGYKDFLFPLG